MSTGKFLLDRSVLKHHIVGTGKPERFCMWVWMLSAATYCEQRWMVKGEEIRLQRGQLFVSIRKFAEENHVSKGVAERFIRDLKTGTMIETDKRTGGTIITICNYSDYQSFDHASETANETANETPTGRKQDADETAAGRKRTKSTKSTTSSASTGEGEKPPDLNDLNKRLLDAIGAAGNQAATGLVNLQRPLAWLQAGCDLEKDILPTIKAVADRQLQKLGQGCIGTWGYFDNPVMQAKAERLKPLPKMEAGHGAGSYQNSRSKGAAPQSSRELMRAALDAPSNQNDVINITAEEVN